MIVQGFVKLRRVGRSFVEHDEITLSADRKVWADVAQVLSVRSYRRANRIIRIEVDWSSLVTEMQRLARYTQREIEAMSPKARQKAVQGKNIVRIAYRIEHKSGRNVTSALLRYFLYEIFLIVNIAAPGAFSAYEAQITGDWSEEPFGLSGELFEEAWFCSLDNSWPPIESLSVATVASWYRALMPGVTDIAMARLPKALYSLLHASVLSVVEPTSLLWLAQCMESLFEVPSALSRNVLQARTFALLGTPPNQKAAAKQLRAFFEARNSFAHGGADVVHPIGDRLSDAVVEAFLDTWMEPAAFGASVIVATLQQHAKNAWRESTGPNHTHPFQLTPPNSRLTPGSSCREGRSLAGESQLLGVTPAAFFSSGCAIGRGSRRAAVRPALVARTSQPGC